MANTEHSTQQPASHSADQQAPSTLAASTLNLQLPGKFRLPDFDYRSLEIWFAAAEVIFGSNAVISEQAKFASLLQHLDSTRLRHIQSILCNPQEIQPFTKAKDVLLNLYAQTPEQKLEKLLNGVNITQDASPSLLLEEIKTLGAGVVTDEDLLKRIWMQKLPAAIQSHIATSGQLNLDLQQTVKVADMIHRILTPVSKAAVAAVAIPAASTPAAIENPYLTQLCAAVSALTTEVSAIKQSISNSRPSRRDNSPRRNNRSPRRDNYSTSRNRSSTPYRRYNYYVKDDLCTYHFRYGTDARRCLKGCKHFKPTSSEN